jgi:hypothetical protein
LEFVPHRSNIFFSLCKTIQSGKKLGVKTTSALNALSSLEQNMWEYKYDCKRMLQTIPMTNDAIDEWILYLEIQAQQLCEEQLANLKVGQNSDWKQSNVMNALCNPMWAM